MSDRVIEVYINGERRRLSALTLDRALLDLGFGATMVATALNGDFVPLGLRKATKLNSGDRLEIVTARQGG